VNHERKTTIMKNMTNAEFQKKLEEMYASHPIITKGPRKTFNELTWVLRQDDVDYNINIVPYNDDNGWLCIPSVKECFIPVRDLAMHVVKVEFDEDFNDDDFDYNGICLTVWLED
jgi:hypothetical protein